MVYFFSKVIDEQKRATCFAQLAPYEDKIQSAWMALADLHRNLKSPQYNTYLENFMELCADAKCYEAARGILNVVSGSGSFLQCDMLGVLYAGNPEQQYYIGARDEVVSKSAYLQTLVALGVTAHAAYLGQKTKDPEAWKVVMPQFSQDVHGAINHTRQYDQLCQDQLYNNLEVNTQRVLHENPNYDNTSLANKLESMATYMRPEFYSQTMVYNDMWGFDNHEHSCYQCRVMLHVNSRYSINIAYLDPAVGGPNFNSVRSPYPKDFTDQNPQGNASWLLFYLSQRDCWTGMVAARTGNDYFTTWGFAQQQYLTYLSEVNGGFTLNLWAQLNMPCIRLAQPTVAELLKLSEEEVISRMFANAKEELPQ